MFKAYSNARLIAYLNNLTNITGPVKKSPDLYEKKNNKLTWEGR